MVCRMEKKLLGSWVITTKMVHFYVAPGCNSMLSLSLRIASI